MDNSQYIRNTKTAMKIAYRVETGITAKDTVRLRTRVHGYDPRPPPGNLARDIHRH